MTFNTMHYSDFEDDDNEKKPYIDPRISQNRWGTWEVDLGSVKGTFSTRRDAEEAIRIGISYKDPLEQYKKKIRGILEL